VGGSIENVHQQHLYTPTAHKLTGTRRTKCRVIAQWICEVSSPHGPADGDGACGRAVTWAHCYRPLAQCRKEWEDGENCIICNAHQITGVIKPKGRNGRSIGMHGKQEMCIQGFGWEI